MSLLFTLGSSIGGVDHSALRYAVTSGGTGIPYNTDAATTNNVQHHFLPVTIAFSARRLYFTYLGYSVGDGFTTAAGYSPALRVGVRQGNGVWKQARMVSNDAVDGTIPDNGHKTCYVDGTFNPGDTVLICTRLVGPASSTAYLLSHPAVAYREGGRILTTTSSDDYTMGAGLGFGAVGTANMSGGGVASITVNNGGSGYTGVGNLYFKAKEAGGKDANYASVFTAGAFDSGYQNATGSGFVTAPDCYVPNPYASDTAIYGPSFISGVPTGSTPITLHIVGDSITRGNTSADQFGDIYGRYGAYERCMPTTTGICNMSISGMSSAGWITPSSKVLAGLADNGMKIRNTLIELGINDCTAGTSYASISTSNKAIAATLQGLGSKILYATWLQSTTGTFTTNPAANQTPNTGAGSTGTRTTYNTNVLAGSDGLTGDYAALNTAAIFADATNSYLWAVNLTADGSHPRSWNGSDTPLAKSGTTYNFFPTRGIEYFVANFTPPTLTA